MTRRCVRNERVFAKKWSAVILCSLIASVTQSAFAANDNRGALRGFRANHQEGRVAEQIFRRQQSSLVTATTGGVDRIRIPGGERFHNHSQRRDHAGGARSIQFLDGQSTELARGVNLDLTSTEPSITLGEKLFGAVNSIEIKVGETRKTLQVGSAVTASEYVAAKQVLASGSQEIVVAFDGSALGGVVNLDGLDDGRRTIRAEELVVPASVTAYGSLSGRSDFQVQGDLTNYGNIAINPANERSTVRFQAQSILNGEGSVISSSANLSLRANRQLQNEGSIASAGELTLTAGESVLNSGSVSSKRDLNVDTPVLVNAGQIESSGGNVNLDSFQPSPLSIDNRGGAIKAHSAINVRNSHYGAGFDTKITGGDLLSESLNLFTGDGIADVNVGEVKGEINSFGAGVHVSARTDELVIGEQKLDGDPTYFNLGTILITGDIVVGERLAILANGNITSAQGLTKIVARSPVGDGQEITIVSGVDMTLSALAIGTQDVPTGAPLSIGETVRVTSNSPTGGTINFEASPGLQILTNGVGANHPGAHVNLLAFRTCP